MLFDEKVSQFLKLEDITIAMIGVSCTAGRLLVYLTATDKPFLYITIGTSFFSYLVTQPIRSSMTKIVGPDDVGKVIKKTFCFAERNMKY